MAYSLMKRERIMDSGEFVLVGQRCAPEGHYVEMWWHLEAGNEKAALRFVAADGDMVSITMFPTIDKALAACWSVEQFLSEFNQEV